MTEDTFQSAVKRGAFDGLSRNKYGNTPTTVEGIKFASKAEAKRWHELRLLERAGEITDLKRQVAFPLYATNEKTVGRYVADFTYRDGTTLVVEDVKGHVTDLFKWKAKHFEAQYGFAIRIIKGQGK